MALTADYTLHFSGFSVPIGFGVLPVGDAGVVTGALICAGAALLPDIDHPSGTVARSLPPFSGWLARIVSRLSGGHRRGTHSVIGLLVFTLLAWLSQNAALPVGDGCGGWRSPVAMLLPPPLLEHCPVRCGRWPRCCRC
ncbi:metal-dependent hydrolase [Kocuria atrinae]|uniref:metal-dependent hydrolase n=1 Tax=Kocuria atrinae TaxID=592377 RepID=UPI0021D46451|nr:metal-dependent hydrolase [Kocuria atrinae]